MIAPIALPPSPPAIQAKPTPRPVAKTKGVVKVDELAIRAASTEFDGVSHGYLVKGNVKIDMPDLSVTCDQAVISVSANEERVDKIVFTGGVIATRGRNMFFGDRVTYLVPTRKLVAEGNTRTKILLPGSGGSSLQNSLGIQKKK